MKPIIEVVDYDPNWPLQFEVLKARLELALQGIALAVEHVGSTAVVGLAAKPILDVDAVVASSQDLSAAIEALAAIGYTHQGNLGIEGREAFKAPPLGPRHHLYVCMQGSLGLRNHLALRDYLRQSPQAVQAYAALKRGLAQQHPTDMGAYVEGKTAFILELLQRCGFEAEQLQSIQSSNRAKPK